MASKIAHTSERVDECSPREKRTRQEKPSSGKYAGVEKRAVGVRNERTSLAGREEIGDNIKRTNNNFKQINRRRGREENAGIESNNSINILTFFIKM